MCIQPVCEHGHLALVVNWVVILDLLTLGDWDVKPHAKQFPVLYFLQHSHEVLSGEGGVWRGGGNTTSANVNLMTSHHTTGVSIYTTSEVLLNCPHFSALLHVEYLFQHNPQA